jgi:hypothetical protein
MENESSAGGHRHDAADARAVDQQHDGEDAVYRERKASDRMRMPHERDESSTAPTAGGKSPAHEEVIGQAARDLANGLVDTDLRGHTPREAGRGPRRAGSVAPARLGRAGRRMRRPGA